MSSLSLPVTATAMLPFGLLHLLLAANVVRCRIATQTYFGHTGNKTVAPAKGKPLTPKSPAADFDPLEVAARTQGNFVENVPIGLIAAALVEANGGSKQILSYVLAVFFASRLAHAFGLAANSPGRGLGFALSSLSIVGLGGWAGYLGYLNL